MQITFNHVTYAYHPERHDEPQALRDIHVNFSTERIVGICGMTGSGKSTFVWHLNGLLRPTAGQVLLDGRDLHGSKPLLRQARQRVGLTFQFPERQLFGRTVEEELSYTLKQRQIPAPERERRIETACQQLQFDFRQTRRRSPFSLSRSDQRKLGIAVMLSLRPELLVLDEPTAGMDRAQALKLLRVLQRLHQEGQTQLLLISHDLELLMNVAEYVIILHQGALLAAAPVSDLLSQPRVLETAGIPLPPVSQLLHRLHEQYPQIRPQACAVEAARQEIRQHVHSPASSGSQSKRWHS